MARQFGLVYRVPDDQQAVFRRSFINLPLANGDDTWELPVPATYILEGDGRVAYASVNADYMDRPEPIDVVRQVTALNRGG